MADRDDQKERNKALEMAVGQIEKQFGKGSIMRLGQKGGVTPIEVIPTGAISIDYALGIGGMPRSSMPSTRSTPLTPRNSASISTACWSRSPTTANRRSRSSKC